MIMVRSFVAIRIPKECAERISALIQDFKKIHAAVRWVNPENIHLTLKFLGSVKKDLIPEISDLIRTKAGNYEPFELQVKGCGAFPSLKNPRVIWLGIQGATEILRDFQIEIEETLVSLGFAREKRPFSAHLTIGRVKGMQGKKKLVTLLVGKAGISLDPFMVKEIVLYRSNLKPTGAVYTPLEKIPLKVHTPFLNNIQEVILE